MICPFYFFEEITKKQTSHYRIEMAKLALHLYYGEGDFNLNRLVNLDQITASSCMGAISWVISQDKAGRHKISYRAANRVEIISQKRKKWLKILAEGGNPDFHPI